MTSGTAIREELFMCAGELQAVYREANGAGDAAALARVDEIAARLAALLGPGWVWRDGEFLYSSAFLDSGPAGGGVSLPLSSDAPASRRVPTPEAGRLRQEGSEAS